MVGFWHVYLNLRDDAPLRRAAFVVLAALMVAGSAVHTLWTARGLALKYCSGPAAPCSELLAAITAYWRLVYDLAAVPGYAGALLLLGLVLGGKTWYPRWTAVVNPGVLALLSPLAERAPAPLGAALVGGFTNLSFAVFFLASVCTTWGARSGNR
jgi:hypothetical protein